MQINYLPYPQNPIEVDGYKITSNCFFNHAGGHWLPDITMLPDPLCIGATWRIYKTIDDWEKEKYELYYSYGAYLSQEIAHIKDALGLNPPFFIGYPQENDFKDRLIQAKMVKAFFDAMPEGVQKGIWQVEKIERPKDE